MFVEGKAMLFTVVGNRSKCDLSGCFRACKGEEEEEVKWQTIPCHYILLDFPPYPLPNTNFAYPPT